MPQAFQEVANPGKMLKDMFGSIPSLPPWHSLNLGQEQQMAADNNLAILPKAAQLANMTEQQIMSMMGSAIPGFDAMRAQASSNISSELKGQIPKDVQDAISNSAAARALGGGFGGSGMHGDLVARDLGITSLNLMDQGLKASESWMAATERLLSPAIAEYTNMFVTPGQQASFDTQERDKSWAYQWLGNQLDAMPNPGVAGMTTGLFNSVRGNPSLPDLSHNPLGPAGRPSGSHPPCPPRNGRSPANQFHNP